MSWAAPLVSRLLNGETVIFRPKGQSMSPIIRSGQRCTVVPIEGPLTPGDVVLCRVGGGYYLHLVKQVDGSRVLIGNNKGHINGWTSTVYGKLISVQP